MTKGVRIHYPQSSAAAVVDNAHGDAGGVVDWWLVAGVHESCSSVDSVVAETRESDEQALEESW
jgi:hypothetical protein